MSGTAEGKKSARGGIAAYALFLAAGIALLLLAGFSSAPHKNWADWDRQGKQYEELTQAFFAGQLHLLEVPAPFLAETDNPYDPYAREAAAKEAGAYAFGDTAYYDGKYYTYFGITPALLFFLPVRLITGKILPSWIAVHLCALLCLPAALFFVSSMRLRFAPDTGRGTVALLSALLILILGLPYLTAFCTSYSLTALTGVLLVMAGFGCFLRAEKAEEGGIVLRKGLLLAGSVLCALSVGCRPLFGISFLLLFPLFGEAIRSGLFFRTEKKALQNTACVLLPALLTGALLLAYNALRFGSPFEFGFRYLLTTRDMTQDTKSLADILTGVYLLAFKLPQLNASFPFLHAAALSPAVRSRLYVEPVLGGFFGLHPLLFIVLLEAGGYLLWSAFRKKKKPDWEIISVGRKDAEQVKPRKGWGIKGFALCALCAGLFVLFADAALAGISQRYLTDFALFFFIPFACLVLHKKKDAGRILTAALILLLLAELALAAGTVLCDGRYLAMTETNPQVYARIASWFGQ